MSDNNLDFMDRLTSDHKSSQDTVKSDPMVLQADDTSANVPSFELATITVTATGCGDYGCGVTGIPILPVVLSKTDYKVSPQDERYFSHSIVSIPSSHTAVASLSTQAYLYCYIEDSEGYCFDEYYTGSDGALKCIQSYIKKDFEERATQSGQIDVQNIDESDNNDFDQDAQPFNCTKDNHSTLDSKYITLYQGDVAWFMVSHAKLSKATLKKYIDDEALRNKRMQKFIVDELTDNKNTINISNSEVGYIKSFSQRKQLAQDGDIASKITISEQNGGSDISGSTAAAAALYRSMERSIAEYYEDLASEAKPMMVALPDPVGEVLAAAEKRNYLISQLSGISEERDYSRKVINALIIKNLEKSSIKTTEFEGKDLLNWGDNDYLGTVLNIGFSDTDPDDLIFKHINEANYRSYLQTSKKIIDLKEQIVSARKTFIKAISSEDFKYILENDFDIELIHDAETAKSFESMVARFIAGCGIDDSNLGVPQSILDAFETNPPKSDETTNEEFKKVLLPQLDRSLEINESWLIKALGGLDKEFVNELYDFKKKDRGSEAAGAGIGYISDRASTAKLNRITSTIANKTVLINTLSHNLFKLYKNNPEAAKQLHIDLERSIFHHYGLYVVGESVTARVETITTYANMAADFVLPKFIKNGINKRASKIKADIKSNFEDFSGLEVVKQPTFGTEAEAKTYVLHYVKEVNRSKQGASALEPLHNGKPINLDVLNADELAAHATKWHNRRMNAGAGLVSGVVAFFQLNSLLESMPELARLEYAGDELLLTEKQLGVASGGLALVTASMDTTAAGASVFSKTSFASKLIYGAGWIGVVGATFEVGSLAIYGYRKFNDGNIPSGLLTIGSGVSVSASAAAGLIYGYAAVSTSSAGTAAIPGAVLLSIMMIGLSLSYSFQRLAYKFDDKNNTLIEYWLDNSVFGHKAMRTQDYYLINPFQEKPAFNSLADDISGFITACSGFFARSALSKNHGRTNGILGGAVAGIHGIKFNSQVVMGQFIDSSELHISIELVTKDGKVLSNLFNMSLSSANGSLQPTGNGAYFDHSKVVIESKDSGTVVTVKDIYIKDSVYSADSFQKGRVIIKYIADATQNPIYPLYDFAYMDNNKY